ncbi:hypothetical protein LINPERPRIM_LOCUS25276 [Linum perenne]
MFASIIDMSPKATPEWITVRSVPPTLITMEGIGWVASHVGKPLNQFVREGLDIKVYLLRDKAIMCLEKLELELEDGDFISVQVVQMKVREYKKSVTKMVWRMTAPTAQQFFASIEGSAGNNVESAL